MLFAFPQKARADVDPIQTVLAESKDIVDKVKGAFSFVTSGLQNYMMIKEEVDKGKNVIEAGKEVMDKADSLKSGEIPTLNTPDFIANANNPMSTASDMKKDYFPNYGAGQDITRYQIQQEVSNSIQNENIASLLSYAIAVRYNLTKEDADKNTEQSNKQQILKDLQKVQQNIGERFSRISALDAMVQEYEATKVTGSIKTFSGEGG